PKLAQEDRVVDARLLQELPDDGRFERLTLLDAARGYLRPSCGCDDVVEHQQAPAGIGDVGGRPLVAPHWLIGHAAQSGGSQRSYEIQRPLRSSDLRRNTRGWPVTSSPRAFDLVENQLDGEVRQRTLKWCLILAWCSTRRRRSPTSYASMCRSCSASWRQVRS